MDIYLNPLRVNEGEVCVGCQASHRTSGEGMLKFTGVTRIVAMVMVHQNQQRRLRLRESRDKTNKTALGE